MRDLKRFDLFWIARELRELPAQSSYYSDVPLDELYVYDYLDELLDAGKLFGSVDNKTSSFLLACRMRPWYANRLEIHEMILWVPAQFRGGSTAYRLIKHFTETAKAEQPHSIHAGATLDITDANKTLALYERCGYTRDGPQGVIMRL
jgi:GNAT superfamily N-acetyltransferase